MKTLHLATITILVLVISIASNVYAQSSSAVSASLAKVSVGLFNITETSPTIVISGIVYKAFSQNIVLTIFNPQNQLISVSQLQPRLDGTFSQSIISSNSLWPKGNYTVRVTSGSQNLTESVFYFPVIGCCKRIIIPGVQGQLSNSTNPLSPLKQFQSGIPAREVTCKQGFQLISKREDGSPACVKPNNAQKLIKMGWAKEVVTNLSTLSSSQIQTNPTAASIPSCVSKIPNQYAIAGSPGWGLCPIAPINSISKILNATGFYGIYNYTAFPDTLNFVLEPGHNGTITILISLNVIRNLDDTQGYPNEFNITNDVIFQHDAGMHNHPGVDVWVKPKSEMIVNDESSVVTITLSASKYALLGNYWVTLPPGFCEGGESIVLTINDCTK